MAKDLYINGEKKTPKNKVKCPGWCDWEAEVKRVINEKDQEMVNGLTEEQKKKLKKNRGVDFKR